LISLLFCDLLVQTSFGFILVASPFSISFFFSSSHSPLTWKERDGNLCGQPVLKSNFSGQEIGHAGGWKYFRSPAREPAGGHMEIEIFPDMCFYLAPRPAIVFMDYLIKFANDIDLTPTVAARRFSLLSVAITAKDY